MSKKMEACLVVLLSCFFIATLSGNDNEKQNINSSIEKNTSENQKQGSLTNVQGWALGCSAVLMERNHDRHNTLSPDDINEKSIRNYKKLLDEWWGVKSREDLFESLVWIEKGGHRQSFNNLGETIFGLTEEQYNNIVRTNNEETLNKISIVKQYYQKLGSKSILGWDYARYISLCRWGYLVGYITEDEAWGKIMPAAKILQRNFDSWEDLGQNYIIGRKFWSYKQTIEEGRLYDDALQRLLDMRSSPWNIYPWDVSLDDPNSPDTSGQNKNPASKNKNLI